MDLNNKRILIIKPSSLGDVVHTLPLVHAIKRTYPNCYVAWIVQNAFAPLLEDDPDIDELIPINIPSTSEPSAGKGIYRRAALATLSTIRQLRRKLRCAPFDLALDLHASFRSGLFALAAKRAFRVGFFDARELNTFFQNDHVTCPPRLVHAVDKNLEFARYLGVEPKQEDFRIVVVEAQRERVLRLLNANGLVGHGRLVYINPCARWGTKLWTVEGWARICDILKRQSDTNIVIGGAAQDRVYAEDIKKASGTDCLIAAGLLTLRESTALLSLSDLYVGVDSGPMHIAAFVGTPVLALFGPTDPAKVGPYGIGHRVLRRIELSCLGCRKRVCHDRRCMDELDPVYVAGVCLEMLSSSSQKTTFSSGIFKS